MMLISVFCSKIATAVRPDAACNPPALDSTPKSPKYPPKQHFSQPSACSAAHPLCSSSPHGPRCHPGLPHPLGGFFLIAL